MLATAPDSHPEGKPKKKSEVKSAFFFRFSFGKMLFLLSELFENFS